MNTSCEIIMDLLPLYHDGVCNSASKKLIEQHLEECTTCKNTFEKMKDHTIDNLLKQERNSVVGHRAKSTQKRTVLLGIGIASTISILLNLINVIYRGDEWLPPVIALFAFCGLSLILFLANRHIKTNSFVRAGLYVIFTPILLATLETIFNWISAGAFQLRFINLRFANVNLFVWDYYLTLSANINLLIFLTCAVIGGIILGVGVLRKKQG